MSSQTADKATTQPGKVTRSTWSAFLDQLFAPIDVASLVFFRIAFGVVMLWEVGRFFAYDWIRLFYMEPAFHFTYYGFDWVRPWPGIGMYLHFSALGVLAMFIAFGFMYRASMTLFFFGFTYVFLLDQTNYLNHFYLISLISLLMIFIPAHRAFSFDALLRPNIRSDTVPTWALWLLLAQIGIAYFYAGIAKLNADWLRGEPMGMWLAESTGFPVIGSLFTEEWVAYMFSYGGLFFDLLVVPLLLWQRTRAYAFAAALAFHLTNAWLFPIGIFPWFMIAATLLFFPPSWPRLVGRLRLNEILSFPSWPRLARRLSLWSRDTAGHPVLLRPWRVAILGLFALYFAVQLLVPLRHYLYPGNVSWTDEGYRYSWHMRLSDKEGERPRFVVTDPATAASWEIKPNEYLDRDQTMMMATNPDMVLQFAHLVADDLRTRGYEEVEVRADVRTSLNGREPQPLVDPTVDLAAQQRAPLWPAEWIEPLEEPLPTPGTS